MLVFIWMCVMTSSFVPGGQGVVARHGAAVEANMMAQIEEAAPLPMQSIESILRQRAPGVRRAAAMAR